MSLHRKDYAAALTKARGWLETHPHLYALAAACLFFLVGKAA